MGGDAGSRAGEDPAWLEGCTGATGLIYARRSMVRFLLQSLGLWPWA